MAKNRDLNEAVRQIFSKAIGDGYKKNHVCALTLGSQCVPQFDGFLKGRDFGIKPLERVLNAFDYELHVVPIPKADHNSKSTVDSLFEDCIENVTQILISGLDNESLRTSHGRTSPIFKEAGDEILKTLGLEPPSE